MGGILGLWNLDGRPVDDTVLGRQRATLAHRSSVECLAASSGLAGPAIAFDGRLDNREALLEDLPGGLPGETTDSALALAAYRAFGERFAERLEGDFALGVFDPFQRRLILARDALGVRPLHYHAGPRVVIFASEIKAILAHPDVPARPDDDVVADYLFNQFAGGDTRGATFFRDVFSVPPAHVAIVTPGLVSVRRYWDFDPSRRTGVRSDAEAAEGFREHFSRAVARRLRTPGPVAVAVSGGLDSSAIFCEAERHRRAHGGPPLIGVSYTVADGRPSDEKVFLSDIEREYGVAIDRWDTLPTGLVEGSRDAVWHVEGPLLEARWTGTQAFYRAIRARGATTLLTGHWGDQFLVDDGYLVDLCRRGSWRTVWRHIDAAGPWRDGGRSGMRRDLAHAVVREALPAGVVSALRRLRPDRPARGDLATFSPAFRARARAPRSRPAPAPRGGSVHARALYRTARSRYHVLSMEWHNKVAAMVGLDVAFPFLDRDLIAFLMALPGHLLRGDGVQKGLLRRALAGVLPETIAGRLSKADFSEDVNAEIADDYDKLMGCLRGGHAVASGYLEAGRFTDRGPRRSGAEACAVSWALADLLGLELWLQVFFERRAEYA